MYIMPKIVKIYTHDKSLQVEIGPTTTIQEVLFKVKDSISKEQSVQIKWHHLACDNKIVDKHEIASKVLARSQLDHFVYIYPPTRPSTQSSSPNKPSIPVQNDNQEHKKDKSSPPKPRRKSSVIVSKPSILPPEDYFNLVDLNALVELGFSSKFSRIALLINDMGFDSALDWLLSTPHESSMNQEDQTKLTEALSKIDQESQIKMIVRY